MKEQRKRIQELEDHEGGSCFEIILCAEFVKPFIFTGIHRIKTGLFYKSNRVCFIDWWFIYDIMEH